MRPAASARIAIIGAGSMSSPASLMQTYDAPQIDASSTSIGQYRLTRSGYAYG